MARPRAVVSQGVRQELIADERRLLALAERIGDERNAEKMRRRIDDLEQGRAVSGHHGWEVGLPPNSGAWTLTADDRLFSASEGTDPP